MAIFLQIKNYIFSSLSTLGNSLACITWEDCLKDLPFFKKMTDKSSAIAIKVIGKL